MLAIVAAWACLAAVNAALIAAGFTTGAPAWFPISIFTGPTFHGSGIPFIVLFAILLAWAVRSGAALKGWQVTLTGFALIVLGNLGQGGVDAAFVRPFTDFPDWGIQYYHDAIRITAWNDWLASFNANQLGFFEHTKTHPPFAVLIHHLFLGMSGGSVLFLGAAFTVLTGVSIFLFRHILRVLRVPAAEMNLLTLLFSVLPAVNIYGAVTLDGVILTTSMLFLLGVVLLLTRERFSPSGMVMFLLGMLLTNFLTYGGVFLVAVAGILALREIVTRKRYPVTIACAVSLVVFLGALYAIKHVLGYDHIRGFLTASALENPNGFRGFSEPLVYLSTRIESVCEIALFFALGCCAAAFHPARLNLSLRDVQSDEGMVMLSGVGVLLAMLLAGAFRTGETARCALFIYPYLVLLFTRADSRVLKDLVILAGAQTAAMQLFGGYFW